MCSEIITEITELKDLYLYQAVRDFIDYLHRHGVYVNILKRAKLGTLPGARTSCPHCSHTYMRSR